MRFAYASGTRPLEGYTIKRGIGIGGFGEVYFATSDAGKEVALKRIQRNLEIEVRGVSQCLNLKHVNLLALFDIKYDDHGEGWVVMEYVSGESLKDVLERNPNGVPRPEAERWFQGIAAGVGYLHDHGIVHRDLKPGNIFSDEGVVKIGDYGLSKFISCSRRSGQTESVGTFHYMAPEIGKGVYGKEIDIYALGIILYELLTGRVPFDGESSQEIIMKHLTADPDLTCVDPPYRDAVRRALWKDPEKRFSSVAEMLACIGFGPGGDVDRNGPGDVPEVREPLTVEDDDEPLYITDEDDETDDDDMVFGPVTEIPLAEAVPSSAERAATGRAGATNRETGARATGRAATRTVRREEPIAKAARAGLGKFRDWWRTSTLGTPLKILILLAGLAVVVLNFEILLPPALTFLVVYLVYLSIRAMTSAMRGRSSSAASARPVPRYADWRKNARRSLGQKGMTEKASDLTGAMLMSGLVSAALCLVMLMILDVSFDRVAAWSEFTWLFVNSVAGCWIVLAAGKFWERTEKEGVRRRLAMLLAGLAVGALAFGSSRLLLLPADFMRVESSFGLVPGDLYANQGPELWAYLAYFGLVFVLIRWWRQVDPLRRSRLSVWATAMTVVWALVVHTIVPFPHPWLLPVVISIALQISAPWVNRTENRQFRHVAQEVV